jgi:predicted alpha/beta hydrolase
MNARTRTGLDVQVVAVDAIRLNAIWHLPSITPKRVVIINSATGASQTLYQHFAAWLAERGIATLTYDYRGIGRSATPGLLRNALMSFADWGCLDYAAMLREVEGRFPGVPITVFGHSIGGVIVGYVPHHPASRIVTLGAQTCYWRDWRKFSTPKFLFRWVLIMPIFTHIFGYFPGSKLGYPCDIPAGIAKQWWKGCMSSDFTMASKNQVYRTTDDTPWTALFSAVTTPLTAISISDDPIATSSAVDRLARHFPSAPITRLHWSPSAFGLRHIGHFGFASRNCESRLWPALYEVLTQDV